MLKGYEIRQLSISESTESAKKVTLKKLQADLMWPFKQAYFQHVLSGSNEMLTLVLHGAAGPASRP